MSHFIIKMWSNWYRNSHDKDTTVVRLSYLFNEYTYKEGLYNEKHPSRKWHHLEDDVWVSAVWNIAYNTSQIVLLVSEAPSVIIHKYSPWQLSGNSVPPQWTAWFIHLLSFPRLSHDTCARYVLCAPVQVWKGERGEWSGGFGENEYIYNIYEWKIITVTTSLSYSLDKMLSCWQCQV